MKRVASRQRLVSWDAFDATNDNSSSSDEEYDGPTSSELAICRKRERSQRGKGPVVIPSFSWEISAPLMDFESLAQDVHLHIFSFLNVQALGNVMSLNHKFRQLLLSGDAHILWLQQCRQHWKFPMKVDTKIVDSLSIPTAAGSHQTYSANLRLLFSMTPSDFPTEIDRSLLVRSKHRRSYQNRVEMYQDKATGERLVRYTGPVGGGDRCIRANHPFPKPQPRITSSSWKSMDKSSLLDLLCRRANAVTKGGCYRPFCAPYVDRDGSIQVTPRLVSYFEASILQVEQEAQVNDLPPLTTFRSPRRVECTAIGVATQAFHVLSRMPGWDSHSFGYHGDDGGIYHSSGGMVEHFGPTFGSGDTVGCGIDYVAQGIFYTLNGKFLGYAWKGIDKNVLQNNEWYPVVGIDTNSPISVNFGQKPFQYDLKEFNVKHEMLISPCYQHETPDTALPPQLLI